MAGRPPARPPKLSFTATADPAPVGKRQSGGNEHAANPRRRHRRAVSRHGLAVLGRHERLDLRHRQFQAGSLAALPQWRGVLDRIAAEHPVFLACNTDSKACPSRGVMAWRALLKSLAGAPLEHQVYAVNRFINQWRYRSDAENYGHSDYWATPIEFMTRSGDCEDYAIAKYVSLRELGVPVDRCGWWSCRTCCGTSPTPCSRSTPEIGC